MRIKGAVVLGVFAVQSGFAADWSPLSQRDANELQRALSDLKTPRALPKVRLFPRSPAEFLRSAQSHAKPTGRTTQNQAPCEAFPPEDDDPAGSLCLEIGNACGNGAVSEKQRSERVPTKGSVEGPFEPIIRDNDSYRTAQAYPERLKPLPATVREPLLRDWNRIGAARTELLGEARTLDQEDARLFEDGTRLNTWYERGSSRQRLLEAERDEYYRQCDVSRPPEHCSSWYASLKSCMDRHNVSVAAFFKARDEWNQKRDSIRVRGDALIDKVAGWEVNSVRPFIKNAQMALDDADAGNCSPADHERLLGAFRDKCDDSPASCDDATHCADVAHNSRSERSCAEAARALNETCHAGKHPRYGERARKSAEAADLCTAIFLRKCPGWDPVNGKCTQTQHDMLKAQQDASCGRTRTCKDVPAKDCTVLREFLTRNEECVDARITIMKVCYDGGDRTHKGELARDQEGAEKCRRRVLDECSSASSPRLYEAR